MPDIRGTLEPMKFQTIVPLAVNEEDQYLALIHLMDQEDLMLMDGEMTVDILINTLL